MIEVFDLRRHFGFRLPFCFIWTSTLALPLAIIRRSQRTVLDRKPNFYKPGNSQPYIQEHYMYHSAIFIYKQISKKLPPLYDTYFTPTKITNTRQKNYLIANTVNKNICFFHIKYSAVKIWNNLIKLCFNTEPKTLTIFKNQLKSFILEKQNTIKINQIFI